MTVSMMVYTVTPRECVRDVPISTMRIFNECWLPLGEKLGLETIPFYGGGLVARQSETELITRDLLILREYLVQHIDDNELYPNYMLGRIDGLMLALEEIEADPNLEGSFG